MERHELVELHFITHIENVPSILQRGILCNKKGKRFVKRDISMEEVQDIRKGKKVPGGRPLHEYANLYFQARNPMMYKRCCEGLREELAVLRIRPEIIDQPKVVITDGNAAVFITAFRAAPDGLEIVDRALTFATYWTHADEFEKRRRKAASCAEVLVPEVVPPDYITGAYVATRDAGVRLCRLCATLPIRIKPHLFFSG
jgi:hypothetical protein